jgi:hypothetical protein
MRPTTVLSADARTYRAYSPSEPLLVLGAAALHQVDISSSWKEVLKVLSCDLCDAGLVEGAF